MIGMIAYHASAPSVVAAQRADSTRAGVAAPDTAIDNTKRVSPRRAFLTSMAVPGLMQMRLGRPKAATLFVTAEVLTVAMSAKSWVDLDKAKAARRDTVGTPVLDESGNPVVDSLTGQPKMTFAPRNPNLVGRIRARRAHLEDWLAVVVFNHLFAGADAYVAANLQDFNTNVQVTSTDSGMRVMARVAW
ncbi:MAG: hypothetical protein ABI681_10275 [Gemmatimonadales bacterium]